MTALDLLLPGSSCLTFKISDTTFAFSSSLKLPLVCQDLLKSNNNGLDSSTLLILSCARFLVWQKIEEIYTRAEQLESRASIFIMKCIAPFSIFATILQRISSVYVPRRCKIDEILQGHFAFYILITPYVSPLLFLSSSHHLPTFYGKVWKFSMIRLKDRYLKK